MNETFAPMNGTEVASNFFRPENLRGLGSILTIACVAIFVCICIGRDCYQNYLYRPVRIVHCGGQHIAPPQDDPNLDIVDYIEMANSQEGPFHLENAHNTDETQADPVESGSKKPKIARQLSKMNDDEQAMKTMILNEWNKMVANFFDMQYILVFCLTLYVMKDVAYLKDQRFSIRIIAIRLPPGKKLRIAIINGKMIPISCRS